MPTRICGAAIVLLLVVASLAASRPHHHRPARHPVATTADLERLPRLQAGVHEERFALALRWIVAVHEHTRPPPAPEPVVRAVAVEPPVPLPPPVAPPAATQDGMPALLRRIGGCESSGDPNGPLIWTAQNPTSSASGAFQFVDQTWAGYGGYSRAMYAPPSVQVEKALATFNASGTGPWAASAGCWG